jgi:hypothetical protein
MYVMVERVSGHSVPNTVTLGVVPLVCRLGIPPELGALQVLFWGKSNKGGRVGGVAHSRGQPILMPKSFRSAILRCHTGSDFYELQRNPI